MMTTITIPSSKSPTEALALLLLMLPSLYQASWLQVHNQQPSNYQTVHKESHRKHIHNQVLHNQQAANNQLQNQNQPFNIFSKKDSSKQLAENRQNDPITTVQLLDTHTREIIDQLCGYPVTCPSQSLQQSPGLCEPCSCLPTCRISRNCCPDVILQSDTEATEATTRAPQPQCMTLHDAIPRHGAGIEHIHGSQVFIDSFKWTMHNTRTTSDNSQHYKKQTQHDSHHDNVVKSKQQMAQAGILSIHNPLIKYHSQYLVVNSCPASHQDTEHTSLCENTNSQFILDYIPVTDSVTGLIYRNKHCALCNGVKDFIFWQMINHCPTLYMADVFPTVIDDFVTLTQDCLYHVVPPVVAGSRMDSETCRSETIKDYTIQQCNKTGEWDVYNDQIQALCHDPFTISRYEQQFEDNTRLVYKNVFCYICNSNSSQLTAHVSSTHENTMSANTNFSADVHTGFHARMDINRNMNFQTNNSTDSTSCPSGHVMDRHTDTCRKLICPVYAEAVKDKCINKEDKVEGLTVQGLVRVELVKPTDTDTRRNMISSVTRGHTIHEAIVRKLSIETSECLVTNVEVFASSDNINSSDQLYILYQITSTINCSVEKLINLYKELESTQVVLPANIEISDSMTVLNSQDETVLVKLDYRNVNLSKFGYSSTLVDHPNYNNHAHIMLNTSFYCPRISLSIQEYNQSVDEGILDINEDLFQYMSVVETGKVEVCYTDYIHQGDTTSPHQVFTFNLFFNLNVSSTAVSVLCILTVLFTLCIKSKRQQQHSDKFFIVFCMNLLVSQVSLTSGHLFARLGFSCHIIGELTQMFWLATTFSLNVCLWMNLKENDQHNKKKIHKQNNSDQTSNQNHSNKMINHNNTNQIPIQMNTKISCYVSLTYILPAVCTLLNLLISWIQSGPSYGGDSCLVASQTLKLLTFSLPMTLSLCASFSLSISLYFNSGNRVHRGNIKQSCVTKTWSTYLVMTILLCIYRLLAYLYLATNNTVFDNLFCVLTASHGIFILWTMVIRERRNQEKSTNRYETYCIRVTNVEQLHEML